MKTSPGSSNNYYRKFTSYDLRRGSHDINESALPTLGPPLDDQGSKRELECAKAWGEVVGEGG